MRDITGRAALQGDIGLTSGRAEDVSGVFLSGPSKPNGIQGMLYTGSVDLSFAASAVVPTTVENRPASASVPILISY